MVFFSASAIPRGGRFSLSTSSVNNVSGLLSVFQGDDCACTVMRQQTEDGLAQKCYVRVVLLRGDALLCLSLKEVRRETADPPHAPLHVMHVKPKSQIVYVAFNSISQAHDTSQQLLYQHPNMAIGGVNFLQMQHLCQVFLSLWGLRHSYVAIIKLHGYEETTKKLAEWSDKVADELYKTRTTQSAGCLTVRTRSTSKALEHFDHATPSLLHTCFFHANTSLSDTPLPPRLPDTLLRSLALTSMGSPQRLASHARHSAPLPPIHQELLDARRRKDGRDEGAAAKYGGLQ